MGVRGLKTFLDCCENHPRHINISEEVNKWKSVNSDQTPIIVIDFLSLTKTVKEKKNVICGERHQITLNPWNLIFKTLKDTGCSLVFISDTNFKDVDVDVEQKPKKFDEKFRVEQKIRKYGEKFSSYTDLYDQIDNGKTLQEIINEKPEVESDLTKKTITTYRELMVVAKAYGEFYYSVNHNRDSEIASYAKSHNAIAVISNDTDFLIFDGAWQLWWTGNIELTPSNQLTTIEYNRKGLADLCSLSQNQLPLFATLLGNDYTKEFYDELDGFHKSFGPIKYKIQNVCRYVGRIGNENLSNSDIRRISEQVFNSADNKIQQLVRQSLISYDIDVSPTILDPLAEKLRLNTKLNTDVYLMYVTNMKPTHDITMRFYDMRGCDKETNLSTLLIEWKKRIVGVLRQRFKDDAFTLTLLAKKHINQNFMAYTECPIYPDFPLPPLEDLYLENEADDDTGITEIKWRIVQWIMSIGSVDVLSAIKKLPNDFRLIGTILYTLVKNGLLSVLEADGILYTEYKIHAKETMDVEYPTVLVSRHVRAAHIYNVIFPSVRENFTIAGLFSLIQGIQHFDGVYYQNLMEKIHGMDIHERDAIIAPIKNYRIYAGNF